PLFINGKPFGEPARDAIVSHLQGDDVRVLVPERAAPVELAGFTRGGRILRDNESETDAERAESGNAERAHREVFVVVEDLDDDGTLGVKRYFAVNFAAASSSRFAA